MDFGNLKWLSFKRQEIIAIIPFLGGFILMFFTQLLFYKNREKIGIKEGYIYTFGLLFLMILIFAGSLILIGELVPSELMLKIMIPFILIAIYIMARISIHYQKWRIKLYLKKKKEYDEIISDIKSLQNK